VGGTTAAVRHESLPLGAGPPMGAFARALRTGEGTALRFLEAAPRDEAAWRAAIERAAGAVPPMPAGLVARLAARQADLGAGPRALANARAVGSGGVAVVTGQQPGLLGGPLLTFHKVAGAIALARRLDGIGDRRVVPVFWLAGEDHDLDEANRAVVLDRRGQPRRLRLPLEPDGRSLMHLPLDPTLASALENELRELLPATDRGAAMAALAAASAGEHFDTWCLRALLEVFGDSGLVVVEPAVLLPEVGATYAWLLDNAAPIRAAINSSGRALAAAGLPAPLASSDAATALFLRAAHGGPRLRVGLRPDGRVLLRGEPASMDTAALRRILLHEPARGSGNVAGRVFVQNGHLPVLAYIAGPTEIAYLAQVRAAHAALGRYFPLALPRPEGTWIDAKSAAVLAAFDTTPGAVLAGAVEPPRHDDAALRAALDAIDARLAGIDTEGARLLERAGRGPDALRRALAQVRAAWAKASPAVRAAFEADAGVGRARWDRMLNLLMPLGRPQERQLNPLSLAARHGLEAVRTGLTYFDPLPPVHHLIHLEG